MILPSHAAGTVAPGDADGELADLLLRWGDNSRPRLSPDGGHVVFLRGVNEASQLWLWSVADRSERLLVSYPDEWVHRHQWSADGAWVVYLHASRGREAWRLGALNPVTGATIDPLGDEFVQVTGVWTGRGRPGRAAVSARRKRAPGADLYHVDLAHGGSVTHVADNPGFHEWLVDSDLRPRGGIRIRSDGSVEVVLLSGSDCRSVATVPLDESADLAVVGFSFDGNRLFMLSSWGGLTRRLLALDMSSGEWSVIFADPDLDIGTHAIGGHGVWVDPHSAEPDLYSVIEDKVCYHPASSKARQAIERLQSVAHGDPVILDRDQNDALWLVEYVRDDGPLPYYLVNVGTGQAQLLFYSRPGLIGRRLAAMVPFACSARDGTRLGGYYVAPRGTGHFPTIVMVHGGPAERDYWRFCPEAQFFASRGYLCLHVNFRGSTGYGLRFRQAGHGQWGAAMQEDLYDAIQWGIGEGLVDAARIALFGTSYGGFAALYGVLTRPDLVRCAVAISPLCDLESFAGRTGGYWRALMPLARLQLYGTTEPTEVERAALRVRSPMGLADGRAASALVVHGACDPRIPVADVDRFVAELRSQDGDIEYIRLADEGHGIKSSANLKKVILAAERFLARHLPDRGTP